MPPPNSPGPGAYPTPSSFGPGTSVRYGFSQAERRTVPTAHEAEGFRTERKAQMRTSPNTAPLDAVDEFIMAGAGGASTGSTWQGTSMRSSSSSGDHTVLMRQSRKPPSSHNEMLNSSGSTHGLINSNIFCGGGVPSPTKSTSTIDHEQPWAMQGFFRHGATTAFNPQQSREFYHMPTTFGTEIAAASRMRLPIF